MQDPQRSLRIQCKSSRSSGDKELVGLFQRQAAAVCAQGPCAFQHIDAAAAGRAVHRQGVGDLYFVQTEERRIAIAHQRRDASARRFQHRFRFDEPAVVDLLAAVRLIVEAFEHLFKAKPLMAHTVGHGKAAGRRALHPDRIIRRLLDLHEEAARADGVGHPALDQDGVARMHRVFLHPGQHPGNILCVEQRFPPRAGHVRLETVVDAGLFAIHGVAAEDVPALGLAVLALEQPQGRRLVGMHLQGQALGAVDEFGQHAEGGLRCAFAEIALRIAFQHRSQGNVGASQVAHALFGELLPSGVAGGDGGKDPLFGEMPVLAVGVTVQGVQHPASQIGAPRPGVVQQEREICCRFHKTLHKRHRCRIVRLGDSRERKKRPHLVKKLNHKSIKEGIQMKQNRIFDQNSSQKARSWHYNMDTNRAEAQFADGSAIAIDCLAIEDEYGNTPAQRAELDWLLYNKPLECVQLVLSGEIEHYLSLGCDHGKLKD